MNLRFNKQNFLLLTWAKTAFEKIFCQLLLIQVNSYF